MGGSAPDRSFLFVYRSSLRRDGDNASARAALPTRPLVLRSAEIFEQPRHLSECGVGKAEDRAVHLSAGI
ncbi:MAG: hypothetical protein QOH32_4409 [Bradyrhizobium sp.]|nr:hypothetical protein [Bradyrhizobium sp.]